MITSIEALRYRCLKYVSQPLDRFHVLVGPNASGKTTFLDTIAFLGAVVSEGPESAVRQRSENFQDLVWKRALSESIQLAIEAAIPEEQRLLLPKQRYDRIRYEIEFASDATEGLRLTHERVSLKEASPRLRQQRELFPQAVSPPASLMTGDRQAGQRTVIRKFPGGNDNFHPESETGFAPVFKLGPRKSALGNLPEDESNFPASTWLKQLLMTGVQQLMLNSQLIRRASPPQGMRGFLPDGSNLPWVLADLKRRDPNRFAGWLRHVQTALPEISDIDIRDRADDRHRYIVLRYGDYEIPSWMASDGTLRLLALTVLPYLPDFSGTYLIEEPENGIHPRAVETVFQSLSSAYNAQILLATHSPVILNIVDPENVLCFGKSDDGATDIVAGDLHPALQHWRHEVSLGQLFAGGVLG